MSAKEGTIELVAHGSEYGHHCGEDQGRFAFVALDGDFDVAVQIAAVANGGAKHFKGHGTPAKAGLMAREGNDPSARYVAIWAVSNEDALYPDAFHFDLRKSPKAWLGSPPKGDFTYGYVNNRGQPAPDLFARNYPDVWVRLQRKGGAFLAFVSKDGKTWRATSTPQFETDFARNMLVGVGLSSAPEGYYDARSTATFTNLRGFPGSKTASKKVGKAATPAADALTR